MQIYTWNTQGNFTVPQKLNVIDQMNRLAAPVFVCIQEGGVNQNLNNINWLSFRGQGVGAFNERCTNYILLNDFARRQPVGLGSGMIRDQWGGAVVGGGVAGRTSIAVQYGNTLVVSWHSLSGLDNADTTKLVNAIDHMRRSDMSFIEGVNIGSCIIKV